MLNFQICYETPEAKTKYIAPQLLTPSRPVYEWDRDDNVYLRFSYDFMPKGIACRAIVALHMFIPQPGFVWRSGVILEREGARVEIIDYLNRRELALRATGQGKREFLSIVAYEVGKIHTAFPHLKYRVLIPCCCRRCTEAAPLNFYAHEILRKFEADGQPHIQCQVSYEMVEVGRLLDGVQESIGPAKSNFQQPAMIFNAPISSLVVNSRKEEGQMTQKDDLPDENKPNAWTNGSFYVFLFVVVVGGLAAAAYQLPLYVLPLIIVGGIVLLAVLGAFHLMFEGRLSQRAFMELIQLAVRQLPLLGRMGKAERGTDRGGGGGKRRGGGTKQE